MFKGLAPPGSFLLMRIEFYCMNCHREHHIVLDNAGRYEGTLPCMSRPFTYAITAAELELAMRAFLDNFQSTTVN